MSVGNIRKLQENTAALYTERKTLRLKRPPLPSGYEISGEGGMMAKQNSSPGGMGYAARRKGDRLRVQGVGTRPPDDMERARLSGSTPFGFPKRICGALPYSDDSISYQDMLSRSLTKVSKSCYVIRTACHRPCSTVIRWCVRTPCPDIFAPCIPDLLMAKDFKASVLHVSKLSIAFPWIPKNSPQSRIALVINSVDHSLSQGAPAGHESAETPIGNESNGAVAGEDSGGRLVKLETPHNKELELSLNIMETTPEDQHSHHGHQDNPNEFRSMRDRMHPPHMSAPSCIVPPTEQLVIRPHIVPLLPTFHGMESENPYAHIKEFEDVCNTFREGGTSIDLMRLKLFPFTLKDKAKIWLNSLRPRTKENEKFYECWERYMEAINACPHHGFDTWLLVSYFYDGMSSSMKQLLETMCGGDFMSKNPEEAMDFLSYVAEVSRGWDEPHRGEVGKMKSQPNALHAKARMYTLNEDVEMKAKFVAMTRRVEELELKKMHEVQVVAETPVQVKPCSICQSYEHLVEECPTIPVAREILENKQMSLDNSSPIAMLRMAILTTQVGGIIQIFHGSQEHLSTNSQLNHLNHPNKLQVLNKQ
ncbi:hypothetical protein CK203_054958 [Vitis vinifera]|uniref:Retrotransposon gag domain-containing protein n=1 Tax=Vitis vinifera TaxID=29760 RepID=A0A438GND0_VITVI|nr:hypothetical protein CK203_054958 [Vitis vinifera]